MRKRIPCKVVRSVTLGKSDGVFRSAGGSNAERVEAASTAYLTYTSRLAVTKTDIDDGFGAGTLDRCA